MNLYNALSQKIEPFTPGGPAVTLYVCGITPYDTTHLGHMFTYATFDLLARYLEYLQYPVHYAQNVTDIDDDILRKANELGEDWLALGNRWTAHFIQDLRAMNVRPPDHYPRATETIAEIIETVELLLQKGAAYEVGGNVYFDLAKWPEFGQLSRIPPDQMLAVANERGNKPDDPHKKRPLDFVLWQAQAPGEPAWDSPWGPGRPGWHIECSTMSSMLLGDQIDIHGGGADLVFPHHESEIVQSEAATGKKPFVRFWMHTAMVRHEGEKMSKSLGNLIMIRDLLKSWSPDAIRLYLGSNHYREAWEYDEAKLAEAAQTAGRLTAAANAPSPTGPIFDCSPCEQIFHGAMDDDLDTPQAVWAMIDAAEQIFTALGKGRNVESSQRCLRRMARVFGLRLEQAEPEERVVAGWNAHLRRFA
jgi:L-cysteine:1D-myo-inositol 2-amino-2-deoxy-alpha-D-glucopyranoside ligase